MKNFQNVYIVNQTFNFNFKLLHCGIESNKNHHMNIKRVDRYVLSYLFKGEGTFIINNNVYSLKKGDLYFIPKGCSYVQYTNSENPYEYYYVAFDGMSCKTLLEKAGLSEQNPIISINDDFYEEKMKLIFECLSNNAYLSIQKANIEFLNILYKLSSLIPENSKPNTSSKYQWVEHAQYYIQNNYQYNINANKISDALHVNRSYLSTIFKEICNQSIKDYLIEYRVHQSIYYLLNSDLSVTQIATKTGFAGPSTFFRIFKQKIGVSPNLYRKYILYEYKTKIKEK